MEGIEGGKREKEKKKGAGRKGRTKKDQGLAPNLCGSECECGPGRDGERTRNTALYRARAPPVAISLKIFIFLNFFF